MLPQYLLDSIQGYISNTLKYIVGYIQLLVSIALEYTVFIFALGLGGSSIGIVAKLISKERNNQRLKR